MDVERTVRKKSKYHETCFQEEHIVYPRTTTEITYVPTLHNMLLWWHIMYAGYTKCSSGAYCVCRVHNMLLKGAYCVREHFVDPQSKLSMQEHKNLKSTTGPRSAVSVTCLTADTCTCLTADWGVASLIPARSHTFVEINRGDWSWNNFYGLSPPFRWFKEGLLSVRSESMCTKYWLTAKSSLPRKKVWLSDLSPSCRTWAWADPEGGQRVRAHPLKNHKI